VAGLRGTLDRRATRVYGIALLEQQPVDLRVQNFQSEEDSMDRAYKQDIPSVIKRLEGLRDAFAALDSKTDWTRLRIEPLLEHAKSLDRLIHTRQFARETTRLRRGVAMFHADLVYFRGNLQGLKKVLESERKAAPRRE
jgi:hypothetical protein